jgi:hypothetical protein
MFSPLQGFQRQRADRFPPNRRRAPTEADMHALRDLLIATAGDIEELMRWAECVVHTADDTAAMRAYDARRQWKWQSAFATRARQLSKLVRRRDRYEAIDYRVLILANALPRPGCSTTQAIREVVAEEWSKLGPRASIVFGQSIDAAAARIFQRLRPETLAPGLRVDPPFADLFPRLSVAPRQARGISRFGRPKTKI